MPTNSNPMRKHVKNRSLLVLLLVPLGSLGLGVSGQTFTTLYNFTASYTGAGTGWGPSGGLILSGNALYGITEDGDNGDKSGGPNDGTVFKINTNGTGLKGLHNFSGGSGGVEPSGSLVVSGNTLYGTTQSGGNSDNGTVFAVNTDGTGFTPV